MKFVCDFVLGGMHLQEIMEAKDSIDCVLSLAADGATAIRVTHAIPNPDCVISLGK